MTQLDVAPARVARPVAPAVYLTGLLLMLSGVVHFGVFLFDDTSWTGPVSWRKPVTFGLSFGLTLITIAWVTGHLEMSRRLSAWLLGVFTVDCVVEVGGITVQAWRGVPSHFNTSTPFDRAVAMTLAAGGLVLVVTLGAFAVVALRGRVRGDAAMRLAIRAGFSLLLVSLATGVAMVARGTILFRTVSPQVAYETAGALKPVHGVALHAVLVLPLLAATLHHLSRTTTPRETTPGETPERITAPHAQPPEQTTRSHAQPPEQTARPHGRTPERIVRPHGRTTERIAGSHNQTPERTARPGEQTPERATRPHDQTPGGSANAYAVRRPGLSGMRLDERGRTRIVAWAVGLYVAGTALALVFSLT